MSGAPPDPPADFDAAVVQLLVAARIDPSYVAFVRHHLHEPDHHWRWCCGSNCDPCVERLARVVEQARNLPGAPRR